jgi:glycosyltransferase involved in cell wall biosynthesis
LRVSFVTLSVSLGSIVYSNIKFAQRLIDEGHEVDFVGIEDVVEEHRESFPPEVRCFALGAYRVRHGPGAFLRYAAERRPDAIVASSHLQCLIVALAVRMLNYKPRLVLKTHISTSELLKRQQTFFDRFLLMRALRTISPRQASFAAVSEAGARELQKELGVEPRRVHALLDPVLPLAVRDGAPADHPWLEDPTVKVALFVGRYHEQKDIPTLLSAFTLVVGRDPSFRLLMYGKGDEETAIRAKVAALDLGNEVAICGYVDPLLAYRKADVFVVSSTYEGLCNVIIEAMSEGCRVVSTDCPVGPREVLEDGKHGQLVPVGDPNALAGAILRSPFIPYDHEAAKRRAQDFHLDAVWPVFADLIGI